MNKERIEGVVMNRFKLGRFPFEVKLSVREDQGAIHVGAALQTADVDDPSKGPRDGLWPAHFVKVEDGASDRDIAMAARTALINALAHEVDEHALFDGIRLTDPHPA